MYPISQLFEELLKRPDREFIVKADVGAEEYDMGNIVDFIIDSTLIPDDNFTIGTVIISKLTIRLRLKGEVPAGARIAPYVAFDTSGITWDQANFPWDEANMPWAGGTTDWLPLGEYYVDSRKKVNDVYEFECLDKLIWSAQPYVSQLTYPATMQAMWDEICAKLGYAYDGTVQIDPTYTVAVKPAGYSMRQVMGFIAGANAASVRAGKDGRIQFKRFAAAAAPDIEMTAADYIRTAETNPVKQFTRFVVTYDAEQELAYAAGSGSADQTLHIINPFMTQAMVNNLHSVMNGFAYQPMEMDARGYPHLDVGDVLTYEKYEGTTWIGAVLPWEDTHVPWNGMVGYSSLILAMVLQYKGGFRMTLDAPSSSEQQSDYVVPGSITQQVEQINKDAVKLGRNYYGVKTTREEGLVVETEGGGGKAVLNADELTFYKGASKALWFDIPNNRYKFSGTLEGVDGTFSGTVSAATIIGSTINGGIINGTSIFGSHIATSTAYPRSEMTVGDNLIGAYMSANNYTAFNPNLLFASAPGLVFVSPSNTGYMYLSASELIVGSTALTMRMYPTLFMGDLFNPSDIAVFGWDKLYNLVTEKTLQDTLNSKANVFTGVTGTVYVATTPGGPANQAINFSNGIRTS